MRKYRLEKEVMQNDELRAEFNDLALSVFHFSFEKWYQDGFWQDSNQPYTLFDGGKAVANISVNRMELMYGGELRHHIQLGTVMTDPAYRRQGLCRYIMDEIRRDWGGSCDAMFLFANQSVLGFYPKLGFQREWEYLCKVPVQCGGGSPQKLCMDSAADREKLRHYYLKRNPFSTLQVVNSYSVLMFYCSNFMKESVYYLPGSDAVVIAEEDQEQLHCHDIFCGENKRLDDILEEVSSAKVTQAVLGFTPKDKRCCSTERIEDKVDTLFVLDDGENIFADGKMRFPILSHT